MNAMQSAAAGQQAIRWTSSGLVDPGVCLRSVCAFVFRALLLLCAGVSSGTSAAAELQWRRERVNLVYQEKALSDLLREFMASAGKPAVISDRIKATITGRFNSPAEEFFNSLCSVFGLLTYYDGGVLYIYSSSEATSRILSLKNVTAQQLRENLRELDALDKRYLLRINDADRMVKVAGPPRYVEAVSEVIGLLDERAGQSRREAQMRQATQPIGSAFRVFTLKYAWAQDTALSVGGREVVVPGVASMLRRLSGNYPVAGGVPVVTALSSNTVPRLRGGGLAARDSGGMRQPDSQTRNFGVPERAQSIETGLSAGIVPSDQSNIHSRLVNISLPRIEADARTNSVVVHDLPERIDRYESLISALDVKAVLVQIEASIVDVSSDSIERLGVDWSQARHHVAVGNGLESSGARTAGAQFAAPALSLPVSGATTVIGNLGRHFLAQVNLLAHEGKAHVHARPSVLTVSNTEAVLENTQTFYVRLAGEREVDLFNITAGTSLRVTPALIEDGADRRIKLAIRIEDGSLTGQTVDQIPVVQRSTVGTQAMVMEGQSLLIGGAAYTVDRESRAKVPWLAEVPALGALFKFQSRQVSRVERLFMITPRVVNL